MNLGNLFLLITLSNSRPNNLYLIPLLIDIFLSLLSKVIAKKVRELLGIEEPYWNRSISLLHRKPLGLFLERKGKTGTEADLLTFEDYKRQLKRQEKSKETKTAFNILWEILIVKLPQPPRWLLVVANKVISEKSLHNTLKRKINKKLIYVTNQLYFWLKIFIDT